MVEAHLFRPGLWSRHGAYAPSLTEDIDKIVGVRNYWVDTHDETEALRAFGLPRYRDPWDLGDYESVLCESRSSVYVTGTDSPLENAKGCTIVRCQYRYNFDGTPLPGFGLAYSEIFGRVVQRHVAWDVRYLDDTSPADTKLLIQAGRGTQKIEGLTAHRVTVFPRSNPDIQTTYLRDLRQAQAVNSQPVNLPPLKGFIGFGRTIPAFNLQFADFQISVERGFPKIVYTLYEGNDMRLFRWVAQDDAGKALRRLDSHLYQTMDFGNLFVP